jgi:hypothetical protein
MLIVRIVKSYRILVIISPCYRANSFTEGNPFAWYNEFFN